MIPVEPKGSLKDLPTTWFLQAAAYAACSYALVFLLPVNGSIYSLNVNWSAAISSCSFFRIYSAITFLLRPISIYIVPFAPKFPIPIFYFKFACRSNIIKLLFPLRYPMNCDTLYLGGMLTSMWIWSEHASASMISTPLFSHNFLYIFPISAFIFP